MTNDAKRQMDNIVSGTPTLTERVKIKRLEDRIMEGFQNEGAEPVLALLALMNVLGWTLANRITDPVERTQRMEWCQASLPAYVGAYTAKEKTIGES